MSDELLPGWSVERLNTLARDVHSNTSRLNDGIRTQSTQADDIKANTADIRQIKQTLQEMQSAEMAELRRRADFPRRLLYAVGVPLFASTVGGLILLFLSGGVHVH